MKDAAPTPKPTLSPTKSSHLPPIPKKPDSLSSKNFSSGLSPPGSPQPNPLRLDTVKRDRSGSAPAVIPYSPSTSPQLSIFPPDTSPKLSTSSITSPSPSNGHRMSDDSSPRRPVNGLGATLPNHTPSAPYDRDQDQYDTLPSPIHASFPSLSELEASFAIQPSPSLDSDTTFPTLRPQNGRSPSPNTSESIAHGDDTISAYTASLTPGAIHSRPSSSSSTTSAPPSTAFAIPFTNEVLPAALYAYLQGAIGVSRQGPRVLLLDVRTREEFDRGRVIGECVCLEPLILRTG